VIGVDADDGLLAGLDAGDARGVRLRRGAAFM
jgi:hypothetical protein